jgi:DNA processing protein
VLALAAAAVQAPIEPASPWSWASRLIEMGGSAQRLINRDLEGTLLHQADWADAEQLARGVTPEFMRPCIELVRSLPAGDARLVTVLDSDYPAALRLAWDRPPFLFVRGPLGGPAVGIAGTPPAGLVDDGEPVARARELARALARRQVTVVAELSSGIGAAAIAAALEAGGSVVAVVDRGLEVVDQELAGAAERQRLLATDHTAVVSPCWPGAASDEISREQGDVLISGLGVGLLVVDGDQGDRVWGQAERCVGHAKHLFILKQLLCREPWATYYGDHPGVTVVDAVDDLMEVVVAMTNPASSITPG